MPRPVGTTPPVFPGSFAGSPPPDPHFRDSQPRLNAAMQGLGCRFHQTEQDAMKPTVRPANPELLLPGPAPSGRDGRLPSSPTLWWGRSLRSAPGKDKLAEVIARSRRLLGMPEDWRLAIVPASDTGAVEIALWSLLGARGVDVLAWESFGANWALDVRAHLGIRDVRLLEAGYGALPDLSEADAGRDLVFVWNRTTSGVCLPDGEWIAEDRRGLAICDATSAVFGIDMPWSRLDVCHLVLAEGHWRPGSARHAGARSPRGGAHAVLDAEAPAAESLSG